MSHYKVVCKPCETKEKAAEAFCAKVVEKVGEQDSTIGEFCLTSTADMLNGKLSAEEFAGAVKGRLEPMGVREEDIAAILRETTEELRQGKSGHGPHPPQSPETGQLEGDTS